MCIRKKKENKEEITEVREEHGPDFEKESDESEVSSPKANNQPKASSSPEASNQPKADKDEKPINILKRLKIEKNATKKDS